MIHIVFARLTTKLENDRPTPSFRPAANMRCSGVVRILRLDHRQGSDGCARTVSTGSPTGIIGEAAVTVMNIAKFERFFRLAAGLDVDKEDLRRYSDFVHKKAYDLLLRGQANAKANGRDVIEPWDLPITKGLQESGHAYRRINEQIELEPILQGLAQLPQLDMAYGEETVARLPEIYGGLSYALARSFKIVDPRLKNPQTAHWETAFQLFDLLL
jgi:hypothetical protein